MNKINHYLSMLCFALGIMLGVQLPNWVNQYVQRVDAHFREAELAIAPYQLLADQLFDGSMQALIDKHLQSLEPLFKREAEPIRAQYQRWQYLQKLHQQLQGNFWRQLQHIALHADQAIVNETLESYQATVPLNRLAIICGLLGGILASILYELVTALLVSPFKTKKA
ncbi:DUF2937 family protein [Neptunicella sp. SCSIO 80796]|uniref:DUF2937 family protein n=1 Tax=Neptunicella plasticusilytica TaxID=3117012 RepID=UPI003A4E0DB0